jgi:hypothetical protein
VVPHVKLEVFLSEAAEVRVVAARCDRLNVVLRRADGPSDKRIHAVGADDDPGALLDRGLAFGPTANADDCVVGDEQLLDGEGFSNLDAGLRRRMHEKRVEHGAARAEAPHPVVRVRDRAAQREWTDIERHSPANGRRPRRRQAFEQPPASEKLSAMRPQDVRRERVAREGRPVDEQHRESAPREQHGGR